VPRWGVTRLPRIRMAEDTFKELSSLISDAKGALRGRGGGQASGSGLLGSGLLGIRAAGAESTFAEAQQLLAREASARLLRGIGEVDAGASKDVSASVRTSTILRKETVQQRLMASDASLAAAHTQGAAHGFVEGCNCWACQQISLRVPVWRRATIAALAAEDAAAARAREEVVLARAAWEVTLRNPDPGGWKRTALSIATADAAVAAGALDALREATRLAACSNEALLFQNEALLRAQNAGEFQATAAAQATLAKERCVLIAAAAGSRAQDEEFRAYLAELSALQAIDAAAQATARADLAVAKEEGQRRLLEQLRSEVEAQAAAMVDGERRLARAEARAGGLDATDFSARVVRLQGELELSRTEAQSELSRVDLALRRESQAGRDASQASLRAEVRQVAVLERTQQRLENEEGKVAELGARLREAEDSLRDGWPRELQLQRTEDRLQAEEQQAKALQGRVGELEESLRCRKAQDLEQVEQKLQSEERRSAELSAEVTEFRAALRRDGGEATTFGRSSATLALGLLRPGVSPAGAAFLPQGVAAGGWAEKGSLSPFAASHSQEGQQRLVAQLLFRERGRAEEVADRAARVAFALGAGRREAEELAGEKARLAAACGELARQNQHLQSLPIASRMAYRRMSAPSLPLSPASQRSSPSPTTQLPPRALLAASGPVPGGIAPLTHASLRRRPSTSPSMRGQSVSPTFR